ncbi:hypothetical protein Vadar_015537 [Vaccinium darrowii]|uniref:Uncharacterized protein n=1 Tax=Vaccinium darrowii TaxID=229202 RepID=A0ACB7YN14_9ERIC|nr:hypothetical protein Vadar_015537 [Vaccinium darrowii]
MELEGSYCGDEIEFGMMCFCGEIAPFCKSTSKRNPGRRFFGCSNYMKGVCAIFPRKGEVWSLYKNWNAAITRADLKKCEYDMVELLEEDDSEFKVLVLEPVTGYKSVFKAQMTIQGHNI